MTDHEAKAYIVAEAYLMAQQALNTREQNLKWLVSAISAALREAEERERERCGQIAYDRADIWSNEFNIANGEGRSDDEDIAAAQSAACLDIAQIILGRRRAAAIRSTTDE